MAKTGVVNGLNTCIKRDTQVYTYRHLRTVYLVASLHSLYLEQDQKFDTEITFLLIVVFFVSLYNLALKNPHFC